MAVERSARHAGLPRDLGHVRRHELLAKLSFVGWKFGQDLSDVGAQRRGVLVPSGRVGGLPDLGWAAQYGGQFSHLSALIDATFVQGASLGSVVADPRLLSFDQRRDVVLDDAGDEGLPFRAGGVETREAGEEVHDEPLFEIGDIGSNEACLPNEASGFVPDERDGVGVDSLVAISPSHRALSGRVGGRLGVPGSG